MHFFKWNETLRLNLLLHSTRRHIQLPAEQSQWSGVDHSFDWLSVSHSLNCHALWPCAFSLVIINPSARLVEHAVFLNVPTWVLLVELDQLSFNSFTTLTTASLVKESRYLQHESDYLQFTRSIISVCPCCPPSRDLCDAAWTSFQISVMGKQFATSKLISLKKELINRTVVTNVFKTID